MNSQRRNLQQGLTPDDVRLLYTELFLLNLAILDNERTGALVQQFQKQARFRIAGIVYSALSTGIGGLNIPPTNEGIF